MDTYYTKAFYSTHSCTSELMSVQIDEWLNGFSKKEPYAEYNWEVVGYVVAHDEVMITVKVVNCISRND